MPLRWKLRDVILIRIEEQEKYCKVFVEAELTIYGITQLKENFRPFISEPRELEICLADVSEIDSSGVQLLLIVKRERQKLNLSTNFTDHSKAVLDVFNLLKLTSILYSSESKA